MTAARAAALLLLAAALLAGRAAAAPLGDYAGHHETATGLVVVAGADTVRVDLYAPDVARLELRPAGAAARLDDHATVREPGPVTFSVDDAPDRLVLATAALEVTFAKRPLRITWRDAAGRVLFAEPAAGGLDLDGDRRRARFDLPPDRHLYGSGSRGLGPDLRGASFHTLNTQVYGYGGPLPVMNLNVPFLATSGGGAVLFLSPAPARLDLGAADPTTMSYELEHDELAYVVMAGANVPAQLERLTWLTGRQPLPPRWALGYLQSKFGYRTRDAAEAVVATMRAKRIPCDAVILDLYWFEHMGDLAWNTARFPDPVGMLAGLRDQGVKTLVISEPYFTAPCRHFPRLTGGGSDLVGQTAAGQPYLLPGWWSCDCDAVLLDMTRPAARTWLWDRCAEFMAPGVEGLWTDLGEPERHPADMQHALGPARQVHNLYNLLWAQAMAEGFAEVRPDARLVNLTRSGHTGIQRHGVFTWSGDVARSFGGLAVQVPIMLNAGLSGLGYHGSDLGGFVGIGSAELFVRWLQFGALGPVMRAHGVDDQPTEPWGWGPDAERRVADAIRLRYRLLPYLYTLARENHDTGLPLARPLFFADDRADLAGVDDAFLLGPDLLVAPVLASGQRQRAVRLPAGSWVDYWRGDVHEGGGAVTVPAPLDELPLLVRAGAIVPMQPVRDFVGETVPDTLLLDVYPPAAGATGSFTLYEDDGSTLAYRRGEFARVALSQEATAAASGGRDLAVIIAAADGAYPGMPLLRTVLATVNLSAAAPSRVILDGRELTAHADRAALLAAGEGWTHDAAAAELLVAFAHAVEANARLEILAAGDDAPPDDDPAARPGIARIGPTPLADSTRIDFRLSRAGRATLTIHDLGGAVVDTLLDRHLPAGAHTATWAGRSGAGRRVASGVYVCRLAHPDGTDARKLTVLR